MRFESMFYFLTRAEQFQYVVPGMASYESQDVDMDAGTAPGSSSISTKAAHFQIFQRHPH